MSVNAGSSSLKFSLFDMAEKKCIASGNFERIGLEGGFYTIKYNGEKIKEEVDLPNPSVAVEVLLERLISIGIVKSLDEINGIGHRIVSGGEKYTKSVLVTDKVIQDLIDLKDFAPLHNPAHVAAIKAFKEVLPSVPMVVVFDTAFHQSMAKDRFLYPVPYEWYTNYGVRKYGAHGTSYRYVSKYMSDYLKKENLKMIICHLGSGCSIAAVKDGKCVDTSMGFTPLAGVMMGTRSGDIDPSIIPFVMEKEGLNAKEVIDILNKKSGFLGVSGQFSDHRDIEQGIANQDERCQLADQIFTNTVVKYIASYYVELGGCDALVFTAGVGENSIVARKNIVKGLKCLGIELDEQKNQTRGEFATISSDNSSVKIYVVPTNEELMIAEDTEELITR